MVKGILYTAASVAVSMFLCMQAMAQTTFAGVLQIDRTIQDWGDVTVKDGPLSCTFEVRNVSSKDQQLTSVVSSCGCTGVKWTHEVMHPGDTGTITATYSNDEGPSQFDKTLSVYVDGVRKPLILHLRGVVHPKKMPLKDTYPVHFGDLGLRNADIKVGNMSQGEEKSTQVKLANIGKKAITVNFEELSEHMTISPATVTIKGQSTAEVVVTVTADRSLWGKNTYTAVPVVNGRKQDGTLRFTAVTKENFETMTAKQKKDAPLADYEGSVSPMPVEVGQKMDAEFTIRNTGRSKLNIYKIDWDPEQVTLDSPSGTSCTVSPNGKVKLHFSVRTEKMKSDSENLCVITLYTDDPQHSIINLYIDAIIL